MTSKRLAFAVTLFVSLLAIAPLSARAADDKPVMISFNYRDADIANVAGELGKHLDKIFVIDTGIKDKITIVAPGPMSPEDAYDAFLIALAERGLTVVEQGKFNRITFAHSASRSNLDVLTEVPDIKHEKFVTVVFKLKNLNAVKFYNEQGPILQSRFGEMRVLDEGNEIIMADFVSNIHRVKKLIDTLDTPENAGIVSHGRGSKAKKSQAPVAAGAPAVLPGTPAGLAAPMMAPAAPGAVTTK